MAVSHRNYFLSTQVDVDEMLASLEEKDDIVLPCHKNMCL